MQADSQQVSGEATGNSSGISFIEFAMIAAALSSCAMTLAPELAAATRTAREHALQCDLEMFRRQIEQYQKDHGERLPAVGTNSESTFVAQLTSRSDEHGETSPRGHFGPYILGELPPNPFNGKRRVLVVAGPLNYEHTAGGGNHGWAFSSTTGEFAANGR
jgi:general secretion pathway protein G